LGGLVEGEAAEEFIAAGMEGVSELADGELEELVFFSVEVEELADAVEEHDAAEGRKGGGVEEAVIPAGVAADES
jgi:hypothetical protein